MHYHGFVMGHYNTGRVHLLWTSKDTLHFSVNNHIKTSVLT